MPIYKSTASSNKPKTVKQDKQKKPVKFNIFIFLLCISGVLVLFLVAPFQNFVRDFLLGAFGLVAYPLFMAVCIVCIAFLNKQKFVMNKKYLIYLTCVLVLFVFIIHLILTSKISADEGFGYYLKRTYYSKTTAGGVIFSLFSFPFIKLVTTVGAYIFSSIALIIFVGLLIDCIVSQKYLKNAKTSTFDFKGLNEIKSFESPDVPITLNSKIAKTKKEIAKQKLGLEEYNSTIISSTMPVKDLQSPTGSRPLSKKEYILTPPEIVLPGDKPVKKPSDIIVGSKDKFYENKTGRKIKEQQESLKENEYNKSIEQELNEIVDNSIDEIEDENIIEKELNGQESEFHFGSENETVEYELDKGVIHSHAENKINFKPQKEAAALHKPTVFKQEKLSLYNLPPASLLNDMPVDDTYMEDFQENIDLLEKVLDDFKIPAKVVAVTVGPAVTRYEISMPSGISVKKVQQHSDDIAMALASNGGIRIEAPIPGKSAVGIEVPNKKITPVGLKNIIESKEFAERTNPLSFVLGKDINGDIQFCNLDKMPHLLVAGSTGSGKSVCLNTMIISLLYRCSPAELRLILIDPKMVEFSVYENLPHLLTPHVITDKEQVVNALNWAIKEMQKRYEIMRENGVVNIKEYNSLQMVKEDKSKKWPYIVIVADELADLMLDNKRELEDKIAKLAGKARAAGIHLVLATQRPSVDIVTGIIKVNLPSRIAFSLTSYVDSKTVLDGGGAEKLLGMGDMLYKPNGSLEPKRIQGAFVSSGEVTAVVEYIKENNDKDFDDDVQKEITKPVQENNSQIISSANINNLDPILKDALKWFIEVNQASITMIQRRFGVGFSRAARIIDQMELNGFISAPDGSKPRTILITLDEFNEKFG